MSNPSFSNIDYWLFELAEGNLSSQQVAQLELFLLQHPELDVDRDMWQVAKVNNDPVPYTQTDALLRRKPVGMYSAVGATLFILLTFVGCYQYLDLDALNNNGAYTASGNGAGNREAQLLSEIENLKADIETLTTENTRLANSIEGKDEATGVSTDENGNEANTILASNNTNTNSITTSIGTNSNVSSNAGNSNREIINGGFTQLNEATSGSLLNVSNGAFGPAEIGVSEINTYAPRAIEYDWYRGGRYLANKGGIGSKYKKKEEIKLSFNSKLKKVARKIQRMMDNPVALKNSRNPSYHVPGALPQDVNFGANGTLLTTRVQTMSRIQWLGEENEQLMNQLAIDGYSYGMRGGLGLQLNHAMYHNGGINVADVAITYSPKFSISKWVSVEPALRFKMGNKTLNHSAMAGVSTIEMDRGNQFDFYQNGAAPIGKSLWYKDLGAGLMVNTKWFFAGVQVDNMLRHQDNVYEVNITEPRRVGTHFIATLGTDWESRRENMSLSPYAVFQKKEKLSEAWVGMNYRWGWFNIGGAVSSNLEPAASIGLKFKQFAINYNVDYTNSIMSNQKALSHQIGLRFNGKTSRFGQRLLNL